MFQRPPAPSSEFLGPLPVITGARMIALKSSGNYGLVAGIVAYEGLNRCGGILRSMFNKAEKWGMRPEGSNSCLSIRKNKGTEALN